jgi:hypothetical protein
VEGRGVDFEFEEFISLALIGTGVEIRLGEISADSAGPILQIIALPADLPEGTYHFHAVTDDHEIVSPTLQVLGPAIMNEEGVQGQRDEDDPLLAPMPTFAPDVVPGSISQAETQSTAQEMPVSNPNSAVFLVLSILAVEILASLGLKVVRKR